MTILLQNDVHLLGVEEKKAGRLEVLEGPTGRRSWPDDVKARIVAESFQQGARVNEVAHRHGLAAQHLSTWRRAAKDGKLVLRAEDTKSLADLAFADLVVHEPATMPGLQTDVPEPCTKTPASVSQKTCSGLRPGIEIEVSNVIVRVAQTTSPKRIAEIVSALRDAS